VYKKEKERRGDKNERERGRESDWAGSDRLVVGR
jgi:hypothetical protein